MIPSGAGVVELHLGDAIVLSNAARLIGGDGNESKDGVTLRPARPVAITVNQIMRR